MSPLMAFDKFENNNWSRFDQDILGSVDLEYTQVLAGAMIEENLNLKSQIFI